MLALSYDIDGESRVVGMPVDVQEDRGPFTPGIPVDDLWTNARGSGF